MDGCIKLGVEFGLPFVDNGCDVVSLGFHSSESIVQNDNVIFHSFELVGSSQVVLETDVLVVLSGLADQIPVELLEFIVSVHNTAI